MKIIIIIIPVVTLLVYFFLQTVLVVGFELYCWYDNEFGYCCQVGRMVYKMAGVDYLSYPEEI